MQTRKQQFQRLLKICYHINGTEWKEIDTLLNKRQIFVPFDSVGGYCSYPFQSEVDFQAERFKLAIDSVPFHGKRQIANENMR
uniref:Uncharacterized protein n=1 Tax=Romanomermis culicivorax TaxID=13658 RepID=A0A915KLT1_ROMCU